MFEKGDENEIQQLEELGKKKLPKEFIMVYQEAMGRLLNESTYASTIALFCR